MVVEAPSVNSEKRGVPKMRADLPSTQEGRSALLHTARIFTNKKKEGRSVTANGPEGR